VYQLHKMLNCWAMQKITHKNLQHIWILNVPSIISQYHLLFNTKFSMFQHAWPPSGVKFIKYLGEVNVREWGGRKRYHSLKIMYFMVMFVHSHYPCTMGKGKGKAVPLRVWSVPEGSRMLRFPEFMTTAQDGGRFVSIKQRPPLLPGNAPDTNFC